VHDAKLTDLVEPVVDALGLQLWGIEYLGQRRRKTLRIYIDIDQGVSLSDCEKVSRQLSSLLDVEDPIAGEYMLEVSSPGMDRPLFVEQHYQQCVGAVVKVVLHQPFDGRRRFKGRLQAVDNGEIVIVMEDHEYILPIESIEKANIVPQFN